MFYSKERILEAIEAHHWDHELEWIPDEISFVDQDDLMMVKNPVVKSINSNKVIRSTFEDAIESRIQEVFDFYDGTPFSWWTGPLSKPDNLNGYLEQKGLKEVDKYSGLAYKLNAWKSEETDTPYTLIEVESDEDLDKLVEVSAQIWGYNNASRQSIFKQKRSYLNLSTRRGGFVIVLDRDKAVGYSNYRYSRDGRVLYLTGSGVLPSWRGKGIYTTLVRSRMSAASDRGCQLVTVQAREGTSEPILRKLGFQEYGTYELYATKNDYGS